MLGKLSSGQRPGGRCRPNRGHSITRRSSSIVAVRCGADELRFRTALLGGLVLNAFPQGTVHEAREDLQEALRFNPRVFLIWESLTPLGRNEFICWVDDA